MANMLKYVANTFFFIFRYICVRNAGISSVSTVIYLYMKLYTVVLAVPVHGIHKLLKLFLHSHVSSCCIKILQRNFSGVVDKPLCL